MIKFKKEVLALVAASEFGFVQDAAAGTYSITRRIGKLGKEWITLHLNGARVGEINPAALARAMGKDLSKDVEFPETLNMSVTEGRITVISSTVISSDSSESLPKEKSTRKVTASK